MADGLTADEREWLRREIDRAKRLRLVQAEIDKAEYRVEHGVNREKNAEKLLGLHEEALALAPPPSPDGYCMALVNIGKWTAVLRVRCSRRASKGRFCGTHAKGRVGEVGKPVIPRAPRPRRVKEHGLERNPWRPWTREEIIEEIRAYGREHGFPPSSEEWRRGGDHPRTDTCIRVFGSWANAVEAAGYERPRQGIKRAMVYARAA